MKHSVIMPAHNEAGCIGETLEGVKEALDGAGFDYEIVVVADHCSDGTEDVVRAAAAGDPRVRTVDNSLRGGYGMAVRAGLEAFTGDSATVMMADNSDSPEDLCTYLHRIEAGAECVFGSRFIRGSRLVDYPFHKLVLNRLGNGLIRLLFRHGLNDTTNAFKAYRRHVLEGCRPYLSVHFNLTVELPLKAVIRGYRYEIVPISWFNRKAGVSKLKIREMGSRYFFILFYCLLEKMLTGADYHRQESPAAGPGPDRR